MTEPLSLDDTKALRKDGDLAAFIKHHMAAARTEAAHRRGLVLRHPDLAAHLTEAPCRFSKPEFWNGFIPPAQWGQKINTEPSRRILLELVEEAERRQRKPLAALEEEAA
jgi:hypothetical protein